MKLRTLIAAAVGSAMLGLAATPAQANVEYKGQYTYLGDFTVPPGTPNSESFSRDQQDGFPTGAFNDYWIFDLDPNANGQLSVNFVPIGQISSFFGGIYNASGFGGCSVGAVCGTAGSIGTMIIEAGTPGIFSGIQAFLPAGQYAVRVQGTNNSTQTSYTGQVAFLVPEPGSLALLGLGLAGLALLRGRRS